MGNKATIKDIANAAGVSVATVSYIMNKTPGKSISEQTRARVLAVAEELHYVPNISAQRLKTNQTKCIAVRLNNDLGQPRFHNNIQGIRSFLASYGYSTLLASFGEEGTLSGCLDACMSGQADGMIYIAARGIGISEEELEKIQKWKIPLSVLDCMGSIPNVNSVVYDYYSCTRDRMDVLLRNGYRKVLYLRPKYQNYKESAREQGIRSALMERDDVSVEVHRLESLDENWYSRYPISWGAATPTLRQELRTIVEETHPDTAIMGYSGQLQDWISDMLYAKYLKNPTTENADWPRRSISYVFPNRDAGVEAAKSLIATLNDENAVRKVSIHPILKFPDPDPFA